MDYCTIQNMLDRFSEEELIQLTDTGDVGIVDQAVLQSAIDDASAFIDGYLQSRYQLPLTEVPRSLVRVACNIVRYFLYDDAATERVQADYDGAVAYLKSVSKGEVVLGASTTGVKPTVAESAEVITQATVFNRNEGGFI